MYGVGALLAMMKRSPDGVTYGVSLSAGKQERGLRRDKNGIVGMNAERVADVLQAQCEVTPLMR